MFVSAGPYHWATVESVDGLPGKLSQQQNYNVLLFQAVLYLCVVLVVVFNVDNERKPRRTEVVCAGGSGCAADVGKGTDKGSAEFGGGTDGVVSAHSPRAFTRSSTPLALTRPPTVTIRGSSSLLRLPSSSSPTTATCHHPPSLPSSSPAPDLFTTPPLPVCCIISVGDKDAD